MTSVYRAQLQTLLADLPLDRDPAVALQVKPFFGGAAAYANGRICLTLTPAGLALKLPAAARQTLMGQGGRALRYFPNAPVKKQYVLLPEESLNDLARWHAWILAAIAAAAAAAFGE